MKNILVASVYDLEFAGFDYAPKVERERRLEIYECIYEMHRTSMEKYLVGLDECMVFRGRATHFTDMFKEVYQRTKELWATGANILFLDVDTLCFGPAEFFRFDKMMMFSTGGSNKAYRDIPAGYTLLCGARYFPHTMPESAWKMGDTMYEAWRTKGWNFETYLYNKMFYAQFPEFKFDFPNRPVPLVPEYNDAWDLNRGKFVWRPGSIVRHYGTSQGVVECEAKMREDFEGIV